MAMIRNVDEVRRIQVEEKGPLKEARVVDDDWTGKTSAKERRKLQNRLHQRAWRRRKAQAHSSALRVESDPQAQAGTFPQEHDLSSAFAAATASIVPTQCPEHQAPRIPPSSRPSASILRVDETTALMTNPNPRRLKCEAYLHQGTPLNINEVFKQTFNTWSSPTISYNHSKLIPPLMQYASSHQNEFSLRGLTNIFFPLSPDHHLITLIQYNVMRAMVMNFSICNLLGFIPLECSAMLSLPLQDATPTSWPSSLDPTPLQRSKSHEYWIDSVPCARLRDNLIQATTLPPRSGDRAFDEDEFCEDICGGLYEGFDDCDQRGVIVWGDPWLVENWEITQGFAEKWGFLLRGCVDMFQSTNQWRERRGEEPLVMELE